ncbi:MAG: hypothetical protein ACRDH0_02050 [Actinomycetota bacterium]
MSIAETAVEATSVTRPWSARRRVGFYTIVLVLLIGMNGAFWRLNLLPVLAWFPDAFLNDFYAPLLDFDHITSGTFAPHTVHYLAIVATHWSFMIGLILQLRNPINKVAPMWQATGGLLIVTPTWLFASRIPPPVVAILALAVIGGALHPASIFRTPPRVGSKPMAALWTLAVVPLLLLLTSQLRLQATGVAADPHWQGLHYSFMAEYSLVLILVLGLGATSLPGWRFSVWTGAFLLVLLGTGFVTHPNYPSSQGVFWGVVMIGFAAAWTLLGERRHKADERSRR